MDGGGLGLWGGVECTVCRVGDSYVDQTVRSGHHRRITDLDRIARLGITHLRYPVLWERTAPDGIEKADWSWSDERLERLRELGIVPIVTLLHHGSGPRNTNLLDPEFPRKLARFAGAVAKRYPWLRCFTPVNEPATTARFSALYGWWYPHAKDERSFYRAVFNQVRAIRQAMDAIRRHIPGAHLVTTEDLGKTYATPGLQYQADYENARRFLTYDLLCGMMPQNGVMLSRLRDLGLEPSAAELEACRCEPDVLGFNYYVTGERWLDERISRYPEECRGGNGRDAYADVEAVRARPDGIAGAGALLRECWDRYRRPLAVTEAHLACTYDEQIRWLRDVCADLLALRERGAHVRAMTVWSLLGAFDWNSMLTRQDGYYESGAFDISSGDAKPTPVARFVRALSHSPQAALASVEGEGWWRRPERMLYAHASAA